MKRFTCELVLALAALTLLASVSTADPGEKDKKGEDSGKKVVIIQIDVSKLPAGVLDKLLNLAGMGDKKPGEKKPGEKKPGEKKPGEKKPGEKKPGEKKPGEKKPFFKKPDIKKPNVAKGKTIGLADAIAIAEKHTGGKAFKAEYEGKGFEIELKTDKGTLEVMVDFSGKVVEDKKPGKKKSD